MPIHNSEVAAAFSRIADLLDIEGANRFRIRAYREAARTVGDLSGSLAEMVAAGEDLRQLPGIGKELAEKLREFVETGSLDFLKRLEKEVPPDLTELLRIAGLGPRKVEVLHHELGITNLKGLQAALKAGRLRNLPGFGEKSEKNIAEELARLGRTERRLLLAVADQIGAPLLAYLKQSPGLIAAEIAGSFRRRKETVGDLDILVVQKNGADVIERFLAYEDVAKVLAHGETKATVLLRSSLQVDLRAVGAESYGAALHYFTGSKAHNVAMRQLAIRQGLKINEYGVFRGAKRVAGKSEEEVYRKLGLDFIPPELRENRGEIEAATRGKLPRLLTLEAIRGDLHAHTIRTDGHATLEEMAQAAKLRGYDYLAITEHSKRVTVAGGLDEGELRAHLAEIDRLNRKLSGIRLLKGCEVDILADGSLDLSDKILKELDLTVCSIHSRFNLPRQAQTERIIKAMANPYFRILGHPTGRLLNERPPYDVDLERVIRAAAEKGRFLELNAHPQRLDLNDTYLKQAKELGVKVAISTDAHSVESLDNMRFGVWQARRGWLEEDDVLNTRSWAKLRKLLKRS